MSSFPNVPTSNVFNTNDYKLLNEGLTIEEANKLYLSLSGGTVGGNINAINLTASSSISSSIINSSQYLLNGTPLNFDIITGITLGLPQSNKVLTLDSGGNINGQLKIANSNIRFDRITDGNIIQSFNGSSSFSMYHFNNGPLVMGTSSADALTFQTNNTGRLTISSSGDVDITGGLNCSSISIGGVPISPSILPALNVSGNLDPAGNGVNLSGYVWYANQSRFYGARFIDSNNFCLLNCSGGGIYNDVLVYTHGTSPLLNMAINNGTLRSQIINGTQEIDTPLLDLRTSQPLNNYRTRMRFGGTSNDNEAWYLETFTNGINSHFNIKNQTSSLGLLGFSFGCPSGVSNSDGTAMVINGSQGNGNFITTNSSSTNGALHLNCGIPQAVPANWNYSPTGSSSASGGTVSISLYCYNNIWVRGSTYASSDGRLKDSIQKIDSIKALNLLNVDPVWYKWKNEENNTHQLGFIAQDLIRNNLQELTMAFNNEELEEDTELNIPAGKQLTVAYDRIPLYLLEIIKNINNRLIKIEKFLEEYDIVE